jgi:hypothetical protein
MSTVDGIKVTASVHRKRIRMDGNPAASSEAIGEAGAA